MVKTSLTVHLAKKNCPLSINFIYVIIHEHAILDDVNKHEHTILNDVNKHEHTILDDYNLTYNSDVYTMYAMRQEKFLDEDFNTVADLSKK